MPQKIALITGANRGLGLETSRQLAKQGYKVLLGCRDEEKGQSAAKELAKESLTDVEVIKIDVNNLQQVNEALDHVFTTFGHLDVLVNNAGILPEAKNPTQRENASAFQVKPDLVEKAFKINTLGPYFICQKVLPKMLENGYGRVVNVSSGMAALTGMEGLFPAYRISKTALNAVTRVFAAETENNDKIKINSVCPGWVRTDMGGPTAARSLEEGADTIVWAATLPEDGPSGGYFSDRKSLDW